MLVLMPVEENRLLLPPMDTPMPTVTIEQVIQLWKESRSLPRLLWQPTPGADVNAMSLLDDNGNVRISLAKTRRSRIAPIRHGHPPPQYVGDRRRRPRGVPICGTLMATREAVGGTAAL